MVLITKITIILGECLLRFNSVHKFCFYLYSQDLKDYLNRVGEVCFADAHKEHKNEGYALFQIFVL